MMSYFFHFKLISSCFLCLFVFKKFLLFSRFHIGDKKYPKLSVFEAGEYGLKYDTPNEFILETIHKCKIKPKAIPRNPAKYPNIMY